MFVYRPEENKKKNTLIAAFLANATSLFEDHAKIFHRLRSDFILTCPIAMKLSPLTDLELKFLKI